MAALTPDKDCRDFTINIAKPAGFVQSGGDYADYMNIKLSNGKPDQTIKLIGSFAAKDSAACFILMKAPANANASTIFIKKKELCLDIVAVPTPPVVAIPPTTTPVVAAPVAAASVTNNLFQMTNNEKDIICLGNAVNVIATGCLGPTSWKKSFNSSYTILYSTNNVLHDIPTEIGIYSYTLSSACSTNNSLNSLSDTNIEVIDGINQYLSPPFISITGQNCTTVLLNSTNCNGITRWYSEFITNYTSNDIVTIFKPEISTNTPTISRTNPIETTNLNGINYFTKCQVGCSLSDASNSINVKEISTTAPTISASSTNYCVGGTPVTLTATGCQAGQVVKWSDGQTGSTIQRSPIEFQGNYAQCNVYDANGILVCEGPISNNITINVSTGLTQTPTISPATKNICSGENATTVLTASGCTSYLWATGETTNAITVNPTATTTYSVRCGSSTTCLGVAVSSTINITNAPAPTTPTITANKTIVPGGDILSCDATPFNLNGHQLLWHCILVLATA